MIRMQTRKRIHLDEVRHAARIHPDVDPTRVAAAERAPGAQGQPFDRHGEQRLLEQRIVDEALAVLLVAIASTTSASASGRSFTSSVPDRARRGAPCRAARP